MRLVVNASVYCSAKQPGQSLEYLRSKNFRRTLIRYALNFYNEPILKSYSAFHALA